jgi:hypothetical protein
LRQPGHKLSLGDPNKVYRATAKSGSGGVKVSTSPAKAQVDVAELTRETKLTSRSTVPKSAPGSARSALTPPAKQPPSSDGNALEMGLGNLNLTDQVRFHHTSSVQESNEHLPQSSSVSLTDTGSELSSDDSLDDVDDSDHVYAEPDFDLIEQLIPERDNTTERDGSVDTVDRDIGHAPLISGSIVQEHSKDAIPQYGLFGRVIAEGHEATIFHNTNVPFSTFICGVQGSGKSHSTACMLENALIPSPQLGHLRAPVSALVFSYGEFSNGGSGFSVSEAAFLATRLSLPAV